MPRRDTHKYRRVTTPCEHKITIGSARKQGIKTAQNRSKPSRNSQAKSTASKINAPGTSGAWSWARRLRKRGSGKRDSRALQTCLKRVSQTPHERFTRTCFLLPCRCGVAASFPPPRLRHCLGFEISPAFGERCAYVAGEGWRKSSHLGVGIAKA